MIASVRLASGLALAGLGVLVAVGVAAADDRPPRPHGPPPEAIAACDGKTAGAECTVTIHDRTITGRCRTAPDRDDGPLACVPDHPPGPPPEAVEACRGKAAGDACTVDAGGHTFAGTCRAGRDGDGPLACAPER